MELWWSWSYVIFGGLLITGCIWLIRLQNKNKTVRILSKSAGSLFLIPCFLLTALFLFAQGCEKHTSLIGSPDGNHVARILVLESGPLDVADGSTVIVRKSWYPIWTNAYKGPAYSLDKPRVKWLNNSQLLIEYPDVEASECVQNVEKVEVICEPLNDDDDINR